MNTDVQEVKPEPAAKETLWAFEQPDVIHVIIFHARRSLQTATAAGNPVALRKCWPSARSENQFLIPPKD